MNCPTAELLVDRVSSRDLLKTFRMVQRRKYSLTDALLFDGFVGQERFTSMTRVYYKDAHACIIMFDLTQRSTFSNAVKWKKDLDAKCSLPDGSGVPCLLLANKVSVCHCRVEMSSMNFE